MSERIYLAILVHPALPLLVPHLFQPSASLQVSNTTGDLTFLPPVCKVLPPDVLLEAPTQLTRLCVVSFLVSTSTVSPSPNIFGHSHFCA